MNTDPLALIHLYDGTTDTQPKIESTYNVHEVVVLSVRNTPVGTPIKLVLETNPKQTATSVDWQPITWPNGQPIILQADDDVMLQACNNRLRIRIVGGTTTASEITLI
jgi:hypothetical protein